MFSDNSISNISSSYLRRDIGSTVWCRRNFVPQRFPPACPRRNIFVVSMMGMSTAGACLALMKHQMNNVFGGVLAFYLVTTAWATARRRDGKTSSFDWGALLVALAVGTAIVSYGVQAAKTPTRSIGGVPAGMFFFPWFRRCAFCHWRHSHARARRGFRCTSNRTPPLAHVLFAVHRHRVLLPRTATSIPPLATQNKCTFYPGDPAADIDDFLAGPRFIHESVQENGHILSNT